MKNEIVKYNKNQVEEIKNVSWEALSDETKKSYQNDYNIFFEYVNKPVTEITATDINNYVTFLEKEKEYKMSTINRKISSLSKFFKVLQLSGDIKNNPVELLKEFKKISYKTSKEIHVPLDLKDFKKVVICSRSDPDHIKKICIMIEFLANSGVRVSEMINIKHADIKPYNEENKIIRIIGKGKKERFVYIPESMLKKIYKLFPSMHEYLFYSRKNTKYSRQHVWRLLKARFQEKTGKNAWPHLIRHFFITYKISVEKQDIKAVSRYAGHADVSTTIEMYVDTSLDDKKAGIKIK